MASDNFVFLQVFFVNVEVWTVSELWNNLSVLNSFGSAVDGRRVAGIFEARPIRLYKDAHARRRHAVVSTLTHPPKILSSITSRIAAVPPCVGGLTLSRSRIGLCAAIVVAVAIRASRRAP